MSDERFRDVLLGVCDAIDAMPSETPANVGWFEIVTHSGIPAGWASPDYWHLDRICEGLNDRRTAQPYRIERTP